MTVHAANIRTSVRFRACSPQEVHRLHTMGASSWTEFVDKTVSRTGSASDDGAAYTPTSEAQP